MAIGVNGGYVLSNVGFTPSVRQSMHGGVTGGLSVRYVCEKYFNTICSIYGEVNYASIGWKEKILTGTDQPVINLMGMLKRIHALLTIFRFRSSHTLHGGVNRMVLTSSSKQDHS